MRKITVIGVDTSKRVFHLVGVDSGNRIMLRKKVSRNKFLSKLCQLECSRVVLEACAASHHWGRCIKSLGHEVQLIAPLHVAPYRRGQKNDYRDAEAIVSAALAPGMHFVGVKSVAQQAEQALHRTRSRLLSHRNAAANALRGLLGEYGLSFRLGLKPLREGARRFAESEQAETLGLVALVHDVLEEIDGLDKRIACYEGQIKQRVGNDETTQQLEKQLRGVGVLSASALRVKVADARDFANGRNFAAYLGLAPTHKGSGGKVKLGSIRRGSDRYLRQLLIHGARSAIYHLGDKQDAQSRWLRELVARRGVNIASVALAHKNARQAWAILAREESALA